ncbi:MAG: ribose-5-phosphate isomerase RpiA [Methanobacterium sp.]|nr:ribose-5-phosphate isomerase RpiA [Methanobacterium sp.]
MNLKKLAGYEAAKLIADGDVVGLGTGSTTHYFIEKLAQRIKEEEMEMLGVPTSYQSSFLARDLGIDLTTLDEHQIDIAVDGADEVDPQMNLIKGGGAAHTMEKIVDSAAEKFIVIVDDSKLVNELGKFPVPVEVIPPAFRVVGERLDEIGGTANIRMAEKKDGPVITDNGNFVLDAEFNNIKKPEELEITLNSIPGVVENGIFTRIVDQVLVGTSEGLKIINKD